MLRVNLLNRVGEASSAAPREGRVVVVVGHCGHGLSETPRRSLFSLGFIEGDGAADDGGSPASRLSAIIVSPAARSVAVHIHALRRVTNIRTRLEAFVQQVKQFARAR